MLENLTHACNAEYGLAVNAGNIAGNREPHVLQAFRELERGPGLWHVAFRYAPDMNHVTAAQYQAAMRGAIPQVAPVLWSLASWWAVVPCCYW